MKLIDVLTIHKTKYPTILKLRVKADIGNGEEEFNFAFNPEDKYGLTPQVWEWLLAHPDFPIHEYTPPTEE